MKNLLKFLFLILLSFLVFLYSKDIASNIIISFDVWKNNLLPSLFPFLIIAKFVINYNFSFKVINNLFSKLFKINPNCCLIFFMSMISGFPSSAKYTKDLLDNGSISKDDADRIILFSHFANPAFILIVLSSNFLNCPKIGYLILFSHYFTNIILGLILRTNQKIDNLNNYTIFSKSFGQILTDSIKDSMGTLFLILGTLVTYSIAITLFNKLPLNIYYKSILSGLIELISGLKSISLLNMSFKLKVSISTMLLSFGGCAIHTQVINILKINYLKFLKFRLLHAIISFVITYFLMYLLRM